MEDIVLFVSVECYRFYQGILQIRCINELLTNFSPYYDCGSLCLDIYLNNDKNTRQYRGKSVKHTYETEQPGKT